MTPDSRRRLVEISEAEARRWANFEINALLLSRALTEGERAELCAMKAGAQPGPDRARPEPDRQAVPPEPPQPSARQRRPAAEPAPEPVLLLPRRLTELEAARELGVSLDTVRRERKRGRLGCVRLGRRIFITSDQLCAYVAQQSTEPAPCATLDRSVPEPSTASGSANGQTRQSFARPGSTPAPDRLGAHRLARATFGKPS